MPPVVITTLSDDPSPVPIAGVVVEIYNTDEIFQTSGTTSSDGSIVITLPDGDYDLLFYKINVSFTAQLQRIIVDHTLTNHFQITGHIKSRPESIDPLRCTVSGFIVGVDGKQAKHRLIFEPVKTVTILSSLIIAPYFRKEVASDENGYFEFELLRNVKYSAYFVFPQDLFGIQPGKLDIITPDSPSVALDVLLFPIPIHLTFSTPTISLTAGGIQDTSITTELTFSDGNIRSSMSSPWAYITTTNTDGNVVEASIADAKVLRLVPLKPGITTISTSRFISDRAFFNPLPDYVTESVIVKVT